jgi:hypothetical protein
MASSSSLAMGGVGAITSTWISGTSAGALDNGIGLY